MKIRAKLLILLFGLLAPVSAYSQATYQNPIITGMNPDPSICRAGDDYYLVTSTFEYYPGLPIYKSKDLVHWKLIGYALNSPESNPLMGCGASGGQYAATIRYNDGIFYVIGTNYGGRGTQGVSYVTATDPAGPWSKPHWLGQWSVDPSLLFEDGVVYYTSPDNKGSFIIGTLDTKTDKFTTPLTKVASGLGGSSPEGPHSYKVNDYYYLMSAEGGTGYEHRDVIQRSKNPLGPYEPSPTNPVVSNMNDRDNSIQAAGHADLIETPDGWWLVCLGIRPQGGRYHHLGRETFLAPITWSEDGWPRVGTDGVMRGEYKAPNLPEHKWEPDPIRDEFDGSKLGLNWNFLRNPYDADWSLTARQGYLRLNGSGVNFKENDSPAYVCRRQTAFDVDMTTRIEFMPIGENEEAGLVLRGNDKNHYDFIITQREGKRVIMFREYLKDKEVKIQDKELQDGAVVLRVKATALEYQFLLEQDGKPAELIATAQTKNLSTEMIGGFTGVFIGMYASGNGKPNTNPADFAWFDYEIK